MPRPSTAQVTQLLREASSGTRESIEKLAPLVYEELRALANHQLRRERSGHTLQPTALVHEAYLKLVGEQDRQWKNRRHFFCAAATAMRRILVNHALGRKAAKRGGGQSPVPLDEAVAVFEERAIDLTALDEALTRLSAVDERKARIVELRFFAGLTEEEIADILGISTRTVERNWRLAKAWLRREVEGA